eukprot:3588802-Amphidinium_carterae.1
MVAFAPRRKRHSSKHKTQIRIDQTCVDCNLKNVLHVDVLEQQSCLLPSSAKCSSLFLEHVVKPLAQQKSKKSWADSSLRASSSTALAFEVACRALVHAPVECGRLADVGFNRKELVALTRCNMQLETRSLMQRSDVSCTAETSGVRVWVVWNGTGGFSLQVYWANAEDYIGEGLFEMQHAELFGEMLRQAMRPPTCCACPMGLLLRSLSAAKDAAGLPCPKLQHGRQLTERLDVVDGTVLALDNSQLSDVPSLTYDFPQRRG